MFSRAELCCRTSVFCRGIGTVGHQQDSRKPSALYRLFFFQDCHCLVHHGHEKSNHLRVGSRLMIKMKNNIYFLEADENNRKLSEDLLTCVRNAAHERKQKLIILTDRCQLFEENARSISIRQLFLGLYREHKLGGDKTETFLSHDEHLVVVQLSIASWNKMKSNTLEADVRSVLKVSKEILRRKMSHPDQTESQSLQTNNSKPDLLNTPKSYKSPQIQSPSGLRHSCLRIPETRTTPGRQTQGPPVHSPKTPARVTGKLHLGSFCNTPEQNLDSQAISELLEQYNQFVQKCRKVDIVDVFLKVKEFFTSNVNEKVMFSQENLVIVEHLPRNDTEVRVMFHISYCQTKVMKDFAV
ncbi:hypothetical protein HOLleu_22864 [Holothuria leucospilota]|uniref:PCNA-interacting partner n=1 Tax=Holothuria leucospilota TaxID=206669 RepID=A0A9Q1BTC1_HOLLE|nr:hypothetical protein HOLleu_22864 [Holothuria leucospilota]